MKVGKEFKLRISVLNGENIYALATIVQYDPVKIEAVTDDSGHVGIQDGGFLSRDGKPTTFLAALKDGKEGQIVVSCNRLGEIGGVSDAGAFCLIPFKVKADGETTTVISLIEAETHLLDPSLNDMEFNLENVEFTVSPNVVATIKLDVVV